MFNLLSSIFGWMADAAPAYQSSLPAHLVTIEVNLFRDDLADLLLLLVNLARGINDRKPELIR
jgi:hypothetical protein